MAVINLIKVKPIVHAWKAQPHDGVVSVITFVLTLAMAPHLDKGILVGVGLSIALFLYPQHAPAGGGAVAPPGRHHARHRRSTTCRPARRSRSCASTARCISPMPATSRPRCFQRGRANPELKYIIVDAEGINQLDATGEEVLYHLTERLQATASTLLVARMKKQFMDTLRRTNVIDKIGEEHFFSRVRARAGCLRGTDWRPSTTATPARCAIPTFFRPGEMRRSTSAAIGHRADVMRETV